MDEMILARVEIVRSMSHEGEILDSALAVDGDDKPLDILEALGLLRIGEHKLITEAEGDGE